MPLNNAHFWRRYIAFQDSWRWAATSMLRNKLISGSYKSRGRIQPDKAIKRPDLFTKRLLGTSYAIGVKISPLWPSGIAVRMKRLVNCTGGSTTHLRRHCEIDLDSRHVLDRIDAITGPLGIRSCLNRKSYGLGLVCVNDAKNCFGNIRRYFVRFTCLAHRCDIQKNISALQQRQYLQEMLHRCVRDQRESI